MNESLKRIWVDFHFGLEYDGTLRLNTIGACRAVRAQGIKVGDKVILHDKHRWVEALLVKQQGGMMYAEFDWKDIAPFEDNPP